MGTFANFTSSCGGACINCNVEESGKPICMQVAIMEHRGIEAEVWVKNFSERFRDIFNMTGISDRVTIELKMFV